MKLLSIIFILIFSLSLHAEEGMWIPMLLERYVIKDMNDKGLRLSSDDIYSINKACLKDAIVIFGRGCTGEVISDEGLVLTNHHCGFRYIQSHSSVDHDYLTNGYWAGSGFEELPNPDLSVTFLIRMEDVTDIILKGTESAITEQQRQNRINENIRKVRSESVKGTHYNSVIKPFHYGNEYYMFIYEEFNDVRLVGAPPATIGNFGEDADNWMWPRHTGDFSLFRIYADSSNAPAKYSPDNIPYKPRKSLSISVNGYKENDFTMVMGYPGTTNEYLIADGIRLFTEVTFPSKIRLREKRLEIFAASMNQSEQIRIQYASKYRDVSNMWKKWQGVIKGVQKYNAIPAKVALEQEFEKWILEDTGRMKKYGNVLPDLKDLYNELSFYILAYEYQEENVLATEIMDFAFRVNSFMIENRNLSDDEKTLAKKDFISETEKFYKDYDPETDLKIMQYMLRSFYSDIDTVFHPEFFRTVLSRYKGDFERYASRAFNQTIFTSKEKVLKYFERYPENENTILQIIVDDPITAIINSYASVYNDEILARYNFITGEINTLNRIYLTGLAELDSGLVLYPDANFTMRVAYGKIEGYSPSDGIVYDHFTTLDGVVEKFRISNSYSIPSKLYQLHMRKDYGPWKNQDGNLPVCFIASNHTSGGNSGSPVLNADGNLIGLNFDRNWEGTMSDIWYDKTICRNICVDIRYILFIIDKFAGAGYLVDEMNIVF